MQTLDTDTDHEMGVPGRLLFESGAMAEAALSRGKNVPPSAVTAITAANELHDQKRPISDDILTNLVTAHHTLAELIAPALPRTMRLLWEESRDANRWMSALGPIGLVRYLMLAAVVSLSTLIVVFAIDRHFQEGISTSKTVPIPEMGGLQFVVN